MKFKVIAGDFPTDTTYIPSKGQSPKLKYHDKASGAYFNASVEVPLLRQVERVEILTEESKKKILGSVGWGLTGLVIGGLVAAPVAVAAGIAGILKGGNAKEVTLVCYLKDGRKFMAIADSNTFTELTALAF